MKTRKLFSILMIITVLVSLLGFSVTKVSAAEEHFIKYLGIQGNSFIFEANFGSGLHDANIFVGSEFHNLSCVFKEDEGRIVCNAGPLLDEFTGQIGVIYLGGQIFWVKLVHPQPEGAVYVVPTCVQPEVLGAMVLLTSINGPYTLFMAGDTLQEVANNASSWIGSYWTSYSIQSSLLCGQMLT